MPKHQIGKIELQPLSPTLYPILKHDEVNNPGHYTNGSMEVIDIISGKLDEAELKGYYRGNILKYLFRYKYKDGVQDLKKARYYLERLVALEEKS